ncbi:N-carbamoylputrescine amidase isoform X2 [Gossypium raimondii]|uniref:N-carbamoylputrescine amidase isoform X2 n=1 Tax=Gossypium raimondii TaxID=29730 RepID=UPI00227BE5AF|nr:N-carbamoylputrescine amidase isoform X2 [Gossypium raimondii]
MEKGNRQVVVSALQFACTDDVPTNLATAERLVRAAHAKGANIILIQELFEGYYFCQAQREDFFRRAKPYNDHPTIKRMQGLAKELGVVLPVSFFEEANSAHYNSVAIIDADGTDLGLYRKSHIPDGPGYQEKFYFNPGDTGFKVFQTKFGKIGVVSVLGLECVGNINYLQKCVFISSIYLQSQYAEDNIKLLLDFACQQYVGISGFQRLPVLWLCKVLRYCFTLRLLALNHKMKDLILVSIGSE